MTENDAAAAQVAHPAPLNRDLGAPGFLFDVNLSFVLHMFVSLALLAASHVFCPLVLSLSGPPEAFCHVR